MGCGGSKNDVVKQNSGGGSKGSAPLTVSEIEKRIEAPKDTHVVNHAGINMKYAWVSQRGYYPDGKIFVCLDLIPQRFIIVSFPIRFE